MAESDFSEKNPFAPFLGKKGPKRAKMRFFGFVLFIFLFIYLLSIHIQLKFGKFSNITVNHLQINNNNTTKSF